jgi:predicted  nucleic acid-binding Zn-ribbon protein
MEMKFEDVQNELKGRTTFEKPVVTREVLIDALKSSAYELSVVKADYNRTKGEVKKLKKDNAKLKTEMVEVQEKATRLAELLNKATSRLEKAEKALKIMGDPEVIGGLPKRMDHVEVFLPWIEKLEELYKRVGDVEEWKKDLTPQWEDHKKRFDVIETKVVTEIEPAVLDLIEKSKNAIDAEELEKKLNEVGEKISDQGNRLTVVEETVNEHTTQLGGKADGAVVDEIKTLAENHEEIMKDLNQRMTSQEGTVLSVRDRFDDMEGNVKEVLDKMEQAEENGFGGGISEDDVDAKIESKYSMIVDQLETAIKSATQDEEEFKRVANDLQGMVKKMQMGKADKHEMAMVKEKMMIDGRLREQVDTLRVLTDMKMTKEDAQRLIIKKANRSELKSAVNGLANNLGDLMERRFMEQEDAMAGPAFVMTSKNHKNHVKNGTPDAHCLSCNRTLDKRRNENLANRSAQSPFAQAEKALKARHAHMGPGGTSLGGGFQVRVPARHPALNSLPPEYSLPKIDPRLRKAVPFIQGNDGNLYHGRSTPQLHTWDMSNSPHHDDLQRPLSIGSNQEVS